MCLETATLAATTCNAHVKEEPSNQTLMGGAGSKSPPRLRTRVIASEGSDSD